MVLTFHPKGVQPNLDGQVEKNVNKKIPNSMSYVHTFWAHKYVLHLYTWSHTGRLLCSSFAYDLVSSWGF